MCDSYKMLLKSRLKVPQLKICSYEYISNNGEPSLEILIQRLRIQIKIFLFFPIALKLKNEGYPTQLARIPLSLYKVFFYRITIL